MKRRLQPVDRTTEIFSAAMYLAGEGRLYNMSGHQIAKQAGCSRTLVHQYFNSMTALRTKVIEHSLTTDNVAILAQAVAQSDPRIKNMTTKQKTLVGEWVAR